MEGSKALRAWVPVLVWLGVIALESTQSMGASHTGALLAHVLAALHIPFTPERLDAINHVLRKTGHFFGYGILCLLFARAWLLSLRPSLDRKPLVAPALLLALFCTLLTASADEWHQYHLAGRTGTPRDVALDMTGAALLSGAAAGRLSRLRY